MSQDIEIAENELTTLKRLNSDYIVKYLGFYSDSNFYYIITKYYEVFLFEKKCNYINNLFWDLILKDGTLDDVINEFKSEDKYIPEERVQYWAIQLLKSIDFLHRNNIIHRDIKPSYD